jgi:3'-phosphoadenosine 5'-phosphosulfate sulfotransferase (PAPS reductase)/FAD synthetase
MSEQGTFFHVAPWREQMLKGGRTVVWFSCGVASAVAAKITLQKYDGQRPVHLVYTDTRSEHEDNRRFMKDCEQWFGHPIEILASDRYRDVDDVIEKERYLSGPDGAKCTGVLKKALRHAYQRSESDIQVFGFDARPKEIARAARFREQNPEVILETPLIERGITHADCIQVIKRAGIEIPAMYKLGYKNNNCIGCVKGATGYWNKVRVDFPEVFAKRARQERMLGHTMCRINGEPVFLDELDPTVGNYAAEPEVECGVLCQAVEVRNDC